MSPPTLLQSLMRTGALRTLDHAFAQTLRRLDPDTPDTVLAAAALASLAVASGHAGFDPADPRRLVDAAIDWPPTDIWHAALAASRWVTHPDSSDIESAADAPLVFERGLLYLRRYREYERRLARGLRRIGAPASDTGDFAALAPLFALLFPSPRLRGDKPAGTAGLDRASQCAQSADEGRALDLALTDLRTLSDDHQPRTAALALRHALLLVTGGPGTGKTTAITRLLVLLVAQAKAAGNPTPRIALAAPTGRAAERMAESVRNAVHALAATGIDPVLIAALPTTGTTLHRLLGTIPDSPAFRHHADNPLPFDVVVVDEASMIDLPLMARLVEAIADGARLVLLGDPDQLPSVEAGDVLSGILRAAGDGTQLAHDDADALQLLLGNASAPDYARVVIPTESDRISARHPREGGDPVTLHHQKATSLGSSLRGNDKQMQDASSVAVDVTDRIFFPGRHVHLHRGYRQSTSLDLAPLATAVRDGDAAATLALLRNSRLPGVHFHENLADPLQPRRDRLLAHWSALADAATPAEALALSNRLRLLTAVREGPQGARDLNARIEGMLSGSGLGTTTRRGGGPGYFHGRLLLVTENSYRHRLFNGDIGICMRDGDGTVTAWFPGDDPQHPRPFHPAALPAHDSAFAMTVHKAQGSEFDEVWLLLPARFNRVLSRELVYTGITRARQVLHVAGSAEVITDALTRHAGRWSGLGWRLGSSSGNVR